VAALPIPQKKKKSALAIVMTVFLIMSMVLLTVAMIIRNIQEQDAEKATTAERMNPCNLTSFSFLLALKEGNSVAVGYWKPGVQPKKLFSVHDYTLIKHGNFLQSGGKSFKTPRVFYEYEVQSSTEGGFPIRKRWDVIMEPDSEHHAGKCAIVDLEAAE
jgi:hypothetical protein